MGGSHRDVDDHDCRQALLAARRSPVAGKRRVGAELRFGDQQRRIRCTDDGRSAGGDTRPRVWRRGRSRQRPARDDDHSRCVFGRDWQRRMLPPASSMPGDGARVQAFQRLAGWTWVLGGLGYTAAWLALPIDVAAPVSMAFVAAAMTVTIVQLLRLRSRNSTLQA